MGFGSELPGGLAVAARERPAFNRWSRRGRHTQSCPGTQGGIWPLLEALGLRDPLALRHAAAVACYADDLAVAAGLSEDERAVVYTAGLVHDIGRQAVPVLRTQGMAAAAAAVLAHHELAGAALPLSARIIAVADRYDTLTAPSADRAPLSQQDACAELRRVAGTELNARLVELFVTRVLGA